MAVQENGASLSRSEGLCHAPKISFEGTIKGKTFFENARLKTFIICLGS